MSNWALLFSFGRILRATTRRKNILEDKVASAQSMDDAKWDAVEVGRENKARTQRQTSPFSLVFRHRWARVYEKGRSFSARNLTYPAHCRQWHVSTYDAHPFLRTIHARSIARSRSRLRPRRSTEGPEYHATEKKKKKEIA